MRPTGAPEGTSIAVRGLFFNTPARRKFLKSDKAEGAACLQAALRCALGRPDVSIRCIRDGKEEFFTPGDGRAESAIYALLGRETALGMLPVQSESGLDGIGVSGFTGSPGTGRGSRSAQYFFCNGRHIKSQLLQAAIEQAYKGTLLTGRFPACVIYLSINPAVVDVNVHPAKTEVKFSDERAVFNAVHYAALGALEARRAPVDMAEKPPVKFTAGAAAAAEEPPRPARSAPRWSSGWAPLVDEQRSAPVLELHSPGYQTSIDLTPPPRPIPAEPPRSAWRPTPPASERATAQAPTVEAPIAPEPEPEAEPQNSAPAEPVRVIGEALGLYILAQQGDALVIIDKHAAHERMLYDALMERDAPVHTQSLLEPATLTVSAECAASLEANAEALSALGFEYEPFGRDAFILRSAPATLSSEQAAASLEEAAEALAGERTPDIANARAELMKTVACKAAIKAGPSSEPEEIARLAEAVCSGRVRYCPHGRPVAWTLTRRDLDKQFKRIL